MTSQTEEALTSPLLTSREVSAYLKVSESTLSRWRADKTGPPCLQMGGIARYRLDALESWLTTLQEGKDPGQ